MAPNTFVHNAALTLMPFMLSALIPLSPTASPVLAVAEKGIHSYKCQSDAVWYAFLTVLLAILLLAKPNPRQGTAHKPTDLVIERTVLRVR